MNDIKSDLEAINLSPFNNKKRKLDDQENDERKRKKKLEPGIISKIKEKRNGILVNVHTLYFNADFVKSKFTEIPEKNTFYRIQTDIGFENFDQKLANQVISLEYLNPNIKQFHKQIKRRLDYIKFPKNFYLSNDPGNFFIVPKTIIFPPKFDTELLECSIPIQSEYKNQGQALVESFYSSYKIKDIRNNLEDFIRKITSDEKSSLEHILYEKGGKFLWKDNNAITEELFYFFFPGMAGNRENFENWKKFKSTWHELEVKEISQTFYYYDVPFNVNIKVKRNDVPVYEFILSFKDYGKDCDSSKKENQLIKLIYNRGVLSIDSFFYKTDSSLLFECKEKFLKNLKTSEKKPKGAFSKRGFLYIRFIANLIRSTGRNLIKIKLEDAWKPGGNNKRPETEKEWQKFLNERKWQGENIGNGEQGTAAECEYYGFYASVMKPTSEFLKIDVRSDKDDHYLTYFKPWLSGTASKF